MSKKKQDKKKQDKKKLEEVLARLNKQVEEKWTEQITDPKPAVAPRREPEQKEYKWP